MANKMLIDATHPEETRVVVLRGNRVEEFDFETAQRKQLRGNIYLAKVTRVEPSLQAAFVDYGGNRHGFLAFSEIHPDYYQIPVADRQALIEADARAARDAEAESDQRGRRPRGRGRYERAAARAEEIVSSDTLTAGGLAHEAAEIPAGENVMGEPVANQHVQPVASALERETETPSESAPIGETENLPTSAETGSEFVPPRTEPDQREGEGRGIAEAAPEHAEAEAPSYDVTPPSEDAGAPPAASEAERNGHDGNGTEEEEVETVESVGGADALEEVPDRAPRYRRQYKIQEVIKRRQIMLVQVVKEERGTKGAALTTYLSLAGRYCVLMPNTARGGGISRKITSPEDRKRLREIADELQVPEGMGVILRTAGASRTKTEVKRDFEYLLRLWETVRDITLKSTAPTLVYEEGSLIKRSIRDLYSKDIEEVVVAGEEGYKEAKEFMRMLMPSHAKDVKLYKDTQPIFTRYGIESQLDAMFSPTVQLPSGGYIVINQTEALVSIDVNSGRATREHHIEDTALKTNLEAAEEIARQLRLRDLAGLIVIDFIDMDEKRNNRAVERRLKDALRNDRARIQVGRISHFGLLEMSRQRIRTSVLESSTEKCPYCGGTGHVRSVSSVALQLLRSIEETLLKGATHNLIVRTRPEIALYVLNQKRAHLNAIEQRFHISITVNADPQVAGVVGFAIDRGEQVMTMEQAKALLAQAEAAPTIHEEEEPQAAEPIEEPEEVGAEGGERFEYLAGASQPIAGEGAREGESGRDAARRRRRRRRGRGRAGEGRELGPLEKGRFAGESLPEHAVSPLADHPPASEIEPAQPGFMPAEAFAGEPRPEGEAFEGGTGERRRRRRGRRGGRRSRREREGDSHTEFAPASAQEGMEQPQRAEWSEQPPAHVPEVVEAPAVLHTEPAGGESAASEPVILPLPRSAPTAAPTSAAPRRRSTVREPAPIFGENTTAVTPMPAPQPPPSAPMPTLDSPGSAESEEARPRRTGWWAKRLLGGDKG
jgi:ribonuclease E